MDTLFTTLFIALSVSGAMGFVLQHCFLRQLRTRHVHTWESLGRTTLFLNNSISNSLAVLRFLWRRQYRALADERFIRFAAFLRGYFAAHLVSFAFISFCWLLDSVNDRNSIWAPPVCPFSYSLYPMHLTESR